MERIPEFKAEPHETCQVCGGTSAMRLTWPKIRRGVFIRMEERIVPCDCPCRKSAHAAEEMKLAEARRDFMERQRYFRAFGHREVTGSFEADDGRNPALMDACSAYVEMFDGLRGQKANGLLLSGPTREGKTFAAEAVAMKLHESGKRVLFDTAAGFVNRVQHSSNMEYMALMERIAKCDLLVIDDFGASRDTSFGRETVFSVIDARVSAKGPMVVTTNLTVGEMAGADSLEDMRDYFRIMERCIHIEANSGVRFTDNADHRKAAEMIFGKKHCATV